MWLHTNAPSCDSVVFSLAFSDDATSSFHKYAIQKMVHKASRIGAYGISRTRDKKGKIIKQTSLPWVNCIHTNVGGGWKTMEVLILEVYETDADEHDRGDM